MMPHGIYKPTHQTHPPNTDAQLSPATSPLQTLSTYPIQSPLAPQYVPQEVKPMDHSATPYDPFPWALYS